MSHALAADLSDVPSFDHATGLLVLVLFVVVVLAVLVGWANADTAGAYTADLSC